MLGLLRLLSVRTWVTAIAVAGLLYALVRVKPKHRLPIMIAIPLTVWRLNIERHLDVATHLVVQAVYRVPVQATRGVPGSEAPERPAFSVAPERRWTSAFPPDVPTAPAAIEQGDPSDPYYVRRWTSSFPPDVPTAPAAIEQGDPSVPYNERRVHRVFHDLYPTDTWFPLAPEFPIQIPNIRGGPVERYLVRRVFESPWFMDRFMAWDQAGRNYGTGATIPGGGFIWPIDFRARMEVEYWALMNTSSLPGDPNPTRPPEVDR